MRRPSFVSSSYPTKCPSTAGFVNLDGFAQTFRPNSMRLARLGFSPVPISCGVFASGSARRRAINSGMSLEENTYKNPTKFIPERFLPPPLGSGELPFSCLFGFGRRRALDLFCDCEKYSLTSEPDRKCPAVHFIERNLWIAIVSILATCTISNTHFGRASSSSRSQWRCNSCSASTSRHVSGTDRQELFDCSRGRERNPR
jgi:hypothetical protein